MIDSRLMYLSVLGLVVCLIACSPSRSTQNEISQNPEIGAEKLPNVPDNRVPPLYKGGVTIETGEAVVCPLSYSDDNVVAKNKIEYFPETDRVKNLDEVEPSNAVASLFNRPFMNSDIQIVNVDDHGGKFHDINSALEKFGIVLSKSQLEEASRVDEYNPIKIKTQDISVYLLKVAASIYEIWVVELPAGGEAFKSALPVTLDRQDIEKRLGEPNFRTQDNSVYIYNFFTSLRSFNIIWNAGKIDRLQYITWDGI